MVHDMVPSLSRPLRHNLFPSYPEVVGSNPETAKKISLEIDYKEIKRLFWFPQLKLVSGKKCGKKLNEDN